MRKPSSRSRADPNCTMYMLTMPPFTKSAAWRSRISACAPAQPIHQRIQLGKATLGKFGFFIQDIAAIDQLGMRVRGVQRLHFVVAHRKRDRKSTRLNSSHVKISYAVFCLKKKKSESGNC